MRAAINLYLQCPFVVRTVEVGHTRASTALSYQIALIPPNTIDITCDVYLVGVCFLRLGVNYRLPPRKFCEKLIGTYPCTDPLGAGAAAGAESPSKIYSAGDCVRTSGKRDGDDDKKRSHRNARSASVPSSSCIKRSGCVGQTSPVGPYFSGPCPDRCKSTRLSICSACMGGIKTCAQQHVCSNNRSVVCGDESTVSVPCWNQRYRW